MIKIICALAVVFILSSCITQINQGNSVAAKPIENINNHLRYTPRPGISWQLQLAGKINTTYDVDLYDVDLVETPQKIIDELHARKIGVICYFSAGTWENFRSDADDFPRDVLGETLEDWPDEKWLDVSRYETFAEIMKKRFDLAAQKKCDGVDPDNVDGYQNENGFDLTYEEQLTYNRWLANEAHKRNLSVALKNDLDQVNALVDFFDFAVNEQCFYYKECGKLLPFIRQNKSVLGVEYELEPKEFCDDARRMNFSWLRMNYDLGGDRISCR